MRPFLARDFQQIAKSRRRDQPRQRAFALEQRIGHHRGAEADESDLAPCAADFRQDLADTGERREMRLARRRRQLVARDRAACLIEQEEIGKRAADVDADTIAWNQYIPLEKNCAGQAACRVYCSMRMFAALMIFAYSAVSCFT